MRSARYGFALVAALVWFLVVATASEWLGRLLAFAVLVLTVLAVVVRPGRARPGEETVRPHETRP